MQRCRNLVRGERHKACFNARAAAEIIQKRQEQTKIILCARPLVALLCKKEVSKRLKVERTVLVVRLWIRMERQRRRHLLARRRRKHEEHLAQRLLLYAGHGRGAGSSGVTIQACSDAQNGCAESQINQKTLQNKQHVIFRCLFCAAVCGIMLKFAPQQ